MCNTSHQLGHMSMIFVLAGALEDFGSVVELVLGFLGHQPIHLWGRASHAGVEHEDPPACVFEQTGFLRIGERGLTQESAMPDASVCAVHEEEVHTAFMRWILRSSRSMDRSVDEFGRSSLKVIGIDAISRSHAPQLHGSIAADTIFDDFLPHNELAIFTLTFELALIVDPRAISNDGIRAGFVDGFAKGEGGVESLLCVGFGFVKKFGVPVVVVDAGLGETFGEDFHLCEFES